ncbi:hypothetical protein [Streptomyces sp. NPDC026673]|uniref:hypothetical protein n=1 Tax=Streptomyces sp. NPDC026673 TaxID=3155724 RepID=UPI0033D751E1
MRWAEVADPGRRRLAGQAAGTAGADPEPSRATASSRTSPRPSDRHDLIPVADEGLRDGRADPRTAAADGHDA